jgi:hypothetical protein
MMGYLVEQYKKEGIGVQAAIDGYLMITDVVLRPAVVAQLGFAVVYYLEVYLIVVQIVKDIFYGSLRQIFE